jgi:CheY-like chemotaxis protein
MQVHGHAERALGSGDTCDVVDVRMRQQDMPDGQRIPLRERQSAFTSSPGSISTASRVVSQPTTKPFLKKGTDRLGLQYHEDHDSRGARRFDVLVQDQDRCAAAGVRVVFARSLESALAEIRKAPPSLVVLDLNNPRTDPLGIVTAMKADAALASIPTVGFASHVQTDVINAARQAGVGEVLARSAFTQQLGEILSRQR